MNKLDLNSENSEVTTTHVQRAFYCRKCETSFTHANPICATCGLNVDEENEASVSAFQHKPKPLDTIDMDERTKPKKTFGEILFIAIGAVLSLSVMASLKIVGGIPACLFALAGAFAGEVVYKAMFKKNHQ